MIREAYQGQQLVLIENEFGEIGIDGGLPVWKRACSITEMNSGCICCSLVGDFGKALRQVIADYHPDRILIEPSGVGKLSDVIAAVRRVTSDEVQLGNFVAVADATKCKMYMKNFGEFYNNQIETANTILLSRTGGMAEDKLDACRQAASASTTPDAILVTTPWDELTGAQTHGGDGAAQQHCRWSWSVWKRKRTITITTMMTTMNDDDHECGCHHHHHHDDDDDDHECCHHHHHHHDNDDDEDEHEHHHHHDECDDPACSCHHHHHHHDHDADEVFTSLGRRDARRNSRR